MTYLEVLKYIKDICISQPNVNSVVRDFDDLNHSDVKYSTVILQDREHSKVGDMMVYRFYVGYADRIMIDKSNEDELYSNAITIINNLANTIDETFDITIGSIIIFKQRFLADCAGAYAAIDIEVPATRCADKFNSGAFNEDYNEDYDV